MVLCGMVLFLSSCRAAGGVKGWNRAGYLRAQPAVCAPPSAFVASGCQPQPCAYCLSLRSRGVKADKRGGLDGEKLAALCEEFGIAPGDAVHAGTRKHRGVRSGATARQPSHSPRAKAGSRHWTISATG